MSGSRRPSWLAVLIGSLVLLAVLAAGLALMSRQADRPGSMSEPVTEILFDHPASLIAPEVSGFDAMMETT